MHLLQALRNQAIKIRADLADSNLFAHMGDRGSHREAIIREFLRPFLPDCYGLACGEVFSSDGKQSAQVDVVLYDAVFSMVLFKNGPQQLFPAESVFGAIEVKSDLNSSELERACQNSRSLKALQRQPTDMLDFSPVARLDFDRRTFTTGETLPRNPYATFAFGFHGPSGETTAVNINAKVQSDRSNKLLLPDFIFVAEPGYMIARIQGSLQGKWQFALPGQDYSHYVFLDIGEDALPLFFLTINVCLGQIRLRALNYVSLWADLVTEIRAGLGRNVAG